MIGRHDDSPNAKGRSGLPRLLVVNPNTSAHITDRMVRAATARAAGRATVMGATASFGAASLESNAELVIAAHAVLDAIAKAPPVDAVIIGAFGDPGRTAAQELMSIPVLGLAQSGMAAAASGGKRFAILTLGPRLEASLRRAAIDAGHEALLAALTFLPGSVLDFAVDRERFTDLLVTAAKTAIVEYGAEAILFGGAPFAGIGDEIGDRIPVPVYDGLTSAVDLALAHLAVRPPPPAGTADLGQRQKPYIGISRELADLISRISAVDHG